MWREFKTFALRGNAVDLAVGLVLGTAFGKIVGSLVVDILMPPLGLLLRGVDFSNVFLTLNGGHFRSLAEAQQANAVTVNIGVFLNAVIGFFIAALACFLLVRQINRWTNLNPAPKASQEVVLLQEIRDLLRGRP